MAFNPDRRKKLIRSYALDWVLVIILLIAFITLDSTEPFHRLFSLTDTSLQHTYAVHERVPSWLLVVIAVVAPMLIILGYSIGIKRSLFDAHSGLLGLFLSVSFTIMITDIVKNTVGRPRPDFLDRCQPASGLKNSILIGLSNFTICTQTNHAILKDGFRSFPSGHSSTSFAGLAFLSFYLAGKLHIFDRKGHVWKCFIVLVPLLAATLVAVSRTMDYRHHWQDVTIGSLLGFFIAWFSYRQYYPAIWQIHSDKAYSPRYDSQGHYVGRGPSRHEIYGWHYYLPTPHNDGGELPKPVTANGQHRGPNMNGGNITSEPEGLEMHGSSSQNSIHPPPVPDALLPGRPNSHIATQEHASDESQGLMV